MATTLQDEIHQGKRFGSVQEEAFLGLQRTADQLAKALADQLKPTGLSPIQYNVLRILRGAGECGRTCGEIGERMITRDPDITRMLDRLEKRGLVHRCRENKDRRVVIIRITEQGAALLNEADAIVSTFVRQRLEVLAEDELSQLCRLLDRVRNSE